MVVDECSSISLNDTECQQEAQTYCECCKAGLDVYNAFGDESFCSTFADTKEGNCLDIFLQCCAGQGEPKYCVWTKDIGCVLSRSQCFQDRQFLVL